MKKKIQDNDLFTCRTKTRLAKVLSDKKTNLKVTVKELRDVDRYFFSSSKTFYENKKTGIKYTEKPKNYNPKKYREFTDANPKHKALLKRVNQLLSRIETPKYLFSKKNYSFKDNAIHHRGNTKFILADIKSFYPNCKYSYVKDFLCKETGLYMNKIIKDADDNIIREETDTAAILARLLTFPIDKKNKNRRSIPQGFPTSTLISYFAYQKMFNELNDLAEKYDYKFSTYVDDITFSYKEEKIMPLFFVEEVKKILSKYGHSISENKLNIININDIKDNKNKFPKITGVLLKRYKVQATPKLHKKLNRLFNKVNSAGPSQNSKEYMQKWNNFISLVGVSNSVDYIENKTIKKRDYIHILIKKNSKDFLLHISPKRIKQLNWEDKIYSAYKNKTLNEFANKYKSVLIEYKKNLLIKVLQEN